MNFSCVCRDCGVENLTFEYIKGKLLEKNIKFDEYGLQLRTKEGKYNNAALLLSDQNPTISKFAVFQGVTVSVFLDKKEFSGSIIKQLDDILYFSNLSNRKKVIITGNPQRKEYFDIPERALREVIVNCYCHRDWTLSGDIRVEFYDDRVMVFSPGSLPNGLTFEDIKKGITAKRNNILVSALDKANYIENYASGIRRVFEDYKNFDKQPEYFISDNGVIVTLYNKNYKLKKNDPINDPINSKKLNKNQRQEEIIKIIAQNPFVTRNKLSKKLNVSEVTIKRDLSDLQKENKLEYQGSKKTGKWVVKSK